MKPVARATSPASKFMPSKQDMTRRCHRSDGDALDEMIKEAQMTKHLPLGDEEEADRPPSREEPEISEKLDNKRPPSRARGAQKPTKAFKGAFAQENFRCMNGGTGATGEANPNDVTIEILQEMTDFYSRSGDEWRTRAYRSRFHQKSPRSIGLQYSALINRLSQTNGTITVAIGTLRKQTSRITTAEEAIQLPGIGQRLADKIEEICISNKLKRLDYAKSEPGYEYLQLFMDIYGVSTNIASTWVAEGHRSFENLKAHENLSANQRIGIEHYDDFKIRIPQHEVTALGKVVKGAAAALDPQVEVIIGGSYRRGAQTSGDIDCLLTKPSTTSSSDLLPFLHTLTQTLTQSGFLVWTLAAPHSDSGSKWHGCCILPGAPKPIWRRIDLLIVPASELGAALIYFTGDDIFNRSIRLLSSKKGMRLNQRGLYKDVLRGTGRVKLNEGSLVEVRMRRRYLRRWGPVETSP